MSTILNPFKKPSAATIAQDSLDESKRQLLVHQQNSCYHKKMAEYHLENITRLNTYLDQKHG